MTSPAERLARALRKTPCTNTLEQRWDGNDWTCMSCDRCKALHEYDHDASASAQGDWQPISTAPKDGTWIELYLASDHPNVFGRMRISNWWARDWNSSEEWRGTPTHWRPFAAPAAPTAGKPVRRTRTCPQDGTCCSHANCATECQGHTS